MMLLTTPDELGPCQVYCEALKDEVRRLRAIEARLTPTGLLAAFRDASPEEYLYAHDTYVCLDGHWDFDRVAELLRAGTPHAVPTYGTNA